MKVGDIVRRKRDKMKTNCWGNTSKMNQKGLHRVKSVRRNVLTLESDAWPSDYIWSVGNMELVQES